MYSKTSNKKMVALVVSLVMVLSVFAVLSFATQPAYAQTPTITFSPSELTTSQITPTEVGTTGVYNPTIVITSQLSDPTSSPVYFYWSTTPSISGIPSGETAYYVATPPAAGVTYIPAGTVLTPHSSPSGAPSFTAGQTAYLIATTQVSTSITSSLGYGEFTISQYTPTLVLSPTSAKAGSSVEISGSGYAPTTTSVTLYFNYAGSSIVWGTVNVVNGAIAPSTYLSVPTNMPELPNSAYYAVVAVDTPGETAVAALQITPNIKVTPLDITGVKGSVMTINGYGFIAGQTISSGGILAGGVGTSSTPVTVNAQGSFTVSVTLLASITSPGPQTIVITLSNPSTSQVFSNAFYVSSPNPAELGFTFVDLITGTSTVYPGDSIAAAVYDFPADVSVSIYVGPTLVGTITTDSNGFGQLPATATMPAMPGGTYTPVATVSSMGLYASTSQVTVTPFFQAVDPTGAVLYGISPSSFNEYVPSTGNITIQAYGLTPGVQYDAYDSAVGAGVYYSGLVTSIAVGYYTATSIGMYPAANGTLIFTYSPDYSGLSTSDAEQITFGTEPNLYDVSAPSYDAPYMYMGYMAIGQIIISSPGYLSILQSGSTGVEFEVSGLIPSTAGALYPGVSYQYNAYLGTSELTMAPYVTGVLTTVTVTQPGTAITGITVSTDFTVNGVSYTATASATGLSITGPTAQALSGQLTTGSSTVGSYSATMIITAYSGTTASLKYYIVGSFSTSSAPVLSGNINVGSSANPVSYGATQTTTVSITSPISTTFSSPTGSVNLQFNMPSVPTGITNVSIVYAGQPVSSAIAQQQVVVSTPGTSVTSGTLTVVPVVNPNTGALTGYYVVGYNLLPSATSWTLYVMTQSGLLYPGGSPETVSSTGAFVDESILSSLPNEAAGTYSVFLVVVASATSSNILYSTYTVPATLTASPHAGYIGSTVTLSATGLQPGAYYDVYFGGMYEGTVQATSSNALSPNTFTIPVVPPGKYKVTLDYTGTTTVAASTKLKVLQYPYLTLMNSVGSPINYAFPGQLVYFSLVFTGQNSIQGTGLYQLFEKSWTTGYLNTFPEVTVYFNGTGVVSVPAHVALGSPYMVYINGSFQMPNDNPGSYYAVYFGLTVIVSNISQTHVNTNGTMFYVWDYFYPHNQYAYLGLVSGNGALLTGISPGQIAELTAAINSTLTTSMQVPLSELNAAITSLNGLNATISTKFGTMYTTLQAINATLTSISNGMATVQTDLGTVKASLNDLNAQIIALNGTVATIQTSLGTVQTSLNNLNATVTGISNGVATIQTTLGTIQTSLNNLNAQIASVNGTVVTIKTDLGNVQTTLASIQGTVSSTATNVNNLVGSVATVQTTLGTIQGQITNVSNGIATIKTQLGTLQTNVSNIYTSVGSTSSSVSSVLDWSVVALVIAIITLILVLIAILQINRIAKQFKGKEEVKTPEEKKPPEGGA